MRIFHCVHDSKGGDKLSALDGQKLSVIDLDIAVFIRKFPDNITQQFSRDHAFAFFDISGADLYTERYSAHFRLRKFESRTLVGIVNFYSEAFAL